MSDASFTDAGYAIMIEDDPRQKLQSKRKSYAPIAFGSKTFNPTQTKMSIYAKEFLSIYFAFVQLGHLRWGSTFPVIVFTNNRSVTRFFQAKLIPPALWNACDYVLQYNFVIANVAGSMNTAVDFLSRSEINLIEKLEMRVRNDIQTKAIEVNIQSFRIVEEEQIYILPDDEFYENQLWEEKQNVRNQAQNETYNDSENNVTELQQFHKPTSGITKMKKEAGQKYYYPCIAKYIEKWVSNCQTCIQTKTIINDLLRTELPNCPEWDLGTEDILQMDNLPNLPPSGGYDQIITAIDSSSRNLFVYPVARNTATAVARVIMDILCKHTYFPTTIITELGTQFNAQITHEVAAVLGIVPKYATMKHVQTIGLRERTHASAKTQPKAATGDFRNNWHKFLPLAVLNHSTTYHASLGCEPSRVFHLRIPHNILDYKLSYNPNPKYPPRTDVADEVQRRMKVILDHTKKNIMHSYLKYNANYDRKANASPLETTDYCYILNPKADTQASIYHSGSFDSMVPIKSKKFFQTITIKFEV